MKPAHAVMVGGEEVPLRPQDHAKRHQGAARLQGLPIVEVEAAELDAGVTAADVVDTATGEVIVEANQELTPSGSTASSKAASPRSSSSSPSATTWATSSPTPSPRFGPKPEEALIEIYRKLRPGDPPTLDTATALFQGMFFDARKYDFPASAG